MNGHRAYLDPPRTSPVRKTQWIASLKGHRQFIEVRAALRSKDPTP